MKTSLYYLGLACLFTHELDAVTHAEWRLLVVLRDIAEPGANTAFVALHVPLFFVVLWMSHHRRARVRNVTRIAIALFLVAHAALHLIKSTDPLSDFQGPLSVALIASAGACGITYLLAQWRQPLVR